MLREAASGQLQLPLTFLDRLAQTASFRYKVYSIPKRTGGYRTIHHPARALKAVQRWLSSTVLCALPVHPAAMAYRPGISIRDNARFHQGARFVLRLDFQGFFPSLGKSDVELLLADNSDLTKEWGSQDYPWFTQIVTRLGRLTIGAPSSPALSNALCYPLDERLAALSQELGVRYTRYADDLTFSTNTANVLRQVPGRVSQILRGMEYPAELSLNPKKTRHTSKRGRQVVTGLILTPAGGLSSGRPTKRRIRAMVHRLESLSEADRVWVAGMLSHLANVEPTFLNALAMKYGADRIRLASRPKNDPPPELP